MTHVHAKVTIDNGAGETCQVLETIGEGTNEIQGLVIARHVLAMK